MNPYLSNYIQTLTRRRQERVTSLLQEARVGKEQIKEVAKRLLETVGDFTPLVLGKDSAFDRIRSDITQYNLRDIRLRLQELFETSNLIALLLESHTSILSSEIVALEKELREMEKFTDNIGFLMPENKTYDYSYLEPFSDDLNREFSLDIFPDRHQHDFGESEQAFVRPSEGMLTLSPEPYQRRIGLYGEFLRGNASAFTLVDTGFRHVVDRSHKGWQMLVASAGPVTSPLAEGGPSGAQVELEFRLGSPSVASEIRLLPFSNLKVSVLSVTIYPNEDNNEDSFEAILEPKVLDAPLSIHFQMQNIARFRLRLNQPVYDRKITNRETIEVKYREFINNISDLNRQERAFSSVVSPSATNSRLFNNDMESRPYSSLRSDRGSLSSRHIAKAISQEDWQVSELAKMAETMIIESSSRLQELDRQVGSIRNLAHYESLNEDENPVSTIFRRLLSSGLATSSFVYYYSLGLRQVEVGLADPMFRGVFVSRVLPSQGDVTEVRISTSEENISTTTQDRDASSVTSVEYSVSCVSDPVTEEDWIPILPSNHSFVSGERIFTSAKGIVPFRMPADRSADITVYRNGQLFPITDTSLVLNVDGSVKGLKLDGDAFAADIFTVDYVPKTESSTVNFVDHGFVKEIPITASSHRNGPGEEFLGTGAQNSITLSHTPFIDFDRIETPIVVKLHDGEIAENLTVYDGSYIASFPSTGTYYRQSGKTLIFNRSIREPFIVTYYYIENNVRFRVVLRCNDRSFVSPKIDALQLKAKTRQSLV